MNCGYCEKEITAEENYCSNCGAPILDFISYPNDLYKNMAVDLFNVRIRCGDCNTLFWVRLPGINLCPFCEGEQLIEINSYPINAIMELNEPLRSMYMGKVYRCREMGKVYKQIEKDV